MEKRCIESPALLCASVCVPEYGCVCMCVPLDIHMFLPVHLCLYGRVCAYAVCGCVCLCIFVRYDVHVCVCVHMIMWCTYVCAPVHLCL